MSHGYNLNPNLIAGHHHGITNKLLEGPQPASVGTTKAQKPSQENQNSPRRLPDFISPQLNIGVSFSSIRAGGQPGFDHAGYGVKVSAGSLFYLPPKPYNMFALGRVAYDFSAIASPYKARIHAAGVELGVGINLGEVSLLTYYKFRVLHFNSDAFTFGGRFGTTAVKDVAPSSGVGLEFWYENILGLGFDYRSLRSVKYDLPTGSEESFSIGVLEAAFGGYVIFNTDYIRMAIQNRKRRE